MVQFVNNCKNYNPTIPKHKPKSKRRVRKSNHKHEYELYRAYERSAYGRSTYGRMIYQTVVGHCTKCDKMIQGHDLLVERGYIEGKYHWMRQVDFFKYDFPIIYVKWDSHMCLQQITDPQEILEMKQEILADQKRRLERSAHESN